MDRPARSLDALHVTGDRVLVLPGDEAGRTSAGLYLPAGVRAKEWVQGGRVAEVGPGAAVPNPDDSDAEPWAEGGSPVHYLPLQAH